MKSLSCIPTEENEFKMMPKFRELRKGVASSRPNWVAKQDFVKERKEREEGERKERKRKEREERGKNGEEERGEGREWKGRAERRKGRREKRKERRKGGSKETPSITAPGCLSAHHTFGIP